MYCSLLVHSTPWCIVVYAPSSTTDAELVLSYITYTYIVTSACNAITSAPPASQPAGSNKHRHRRLIMTRTDQLMLTSCTLPVDREKRKKHDKCKKSCLPTSPQQESQFQRFRKIFFYYKFQHSQQLHPSNSSEYFLEVKKKSRNVFRDLSVFKLLLFFVCHSSIFI